MVQMHEIMEALPNKLWTMQDLEAYALSTQINKSHISDQDIYQQCLSMEIHKGIPILCENKMENVLLVQWTF